MNLDNQLRSRLKKLAGIESTASQPTNISTRHRISERIDRTLSGMEYELSRKNIRIEENVIHKMDRELNKLYLQEQTQQELKSTSKSGILRIIRQNLEYYEYRNTLESR